MRCGRWSPNVSFWPISGHNDRLNPQPDVHDVMAIRLFAALAIAVAWANTAHAQAVTVTLQRWIKATLDGQQFKLTIPRSLFEVYTTSNKALAGEPVDYVILRVLYPTGAPEPVNSQLGIPNRQAIRIIIQPIGWREGGRDDTGQFRLGLNLRGVNRLIPQGEATGPARLQRYVTVDGKTEAYSFKTEDAFTVYGSCLLRTCRAFRTWRGDYSVDYQFAIELRDSPIAVDEAVLALINTFNPQSSNVR